MRNIRPVTTMMTIVAIGVIASVSAPSGSVAAPPTDLDANALARDFITGWRGWDDTTPLDPRVNVDFGPEPFGAVLATDGVGDHQPLDEASQGFGAAQTDIVRMLAFETQALDPAVRDFLFDPVSGIFRPGQPAVRHSNRVVLDPTAFDPGMRVIVIYPSAPREPLVGTGSAFGAAIEWVNPVYGQGPPQGVFAGFPQLDRYDETPDVNGLGYYQFVNGTYGLFSSALVMLDTCSPPQPIDPCFYAFLAGLGGAERSGVTGVQVELYETDGTQRAADRIGEGFGSPVDLTALAPATLTLQPVEAAPTTTAQPSTTIAPAAAAPTSAPPTASTTVAATSTTAVQLSAQPGPVAAAAEVDTPVVVSPPRDSTSTGGIVAVVAGIAALLAGGGIVIGARRRDAGDAAGSDGGTPSPSVLSYWMPDAVDAGQSRDLDGQWAMILERNSEVEGHVHDAGRALSTMMIPYFVGLASAVGDFADPYRRAVSGMVLLTEHQNEQEITTARAKIADLATAVVSVGALLKRAGMRAVRWWRPKTADVATITEEVAELLKLARADAAQATAPVGSFVMNLRPPVIAPKPSWFKPPTGFANPWGAGGHGEDVLYWEMDMMALETGDNLLALVNSNTIEVALDILRVNVARSRGVNVVATADALRLERIVMQARHAERGEPYAFGVDDLEWLMSRRDPAGRQGLATAVSEVEVASAFDGSEIPVILSPDDLRLVEGVMDRPGLADAIADATSPARVDADATGIFRAIIDPAAPQMTAPDLTATGAFDAVIDLPLSGNPIGAGSPGAVPLSVPVMPVPPAQFAFSPTSAIPAGSLIVLTAAGFAYVDATQPMLANPSAPLTAGIATGAADRDTTTDDQKPIIPIGEADARWFDPAWLAQQQQIIGAQGQQLANVVDLEAFSRTLFDSTWFEEDFNLFGLTLDGGSEPAQAAWIVFSLGTSPYESLVRMQYGFLGTQHALNYLETYKSDYQHMQTDVTAAIAALEGLAAALPSSISLLQDERDALDAMADEVGAFAEANPEWSENNGAAIEAKLARDLVTIEQLDQSLAALRHLVELLANLAPWIRQLAIAPDGSDISPLTLVNPTSLLRLASALLAVSDAYGRVFLLAPAREDH